MKYPLKPIDARGRRIRKGDRVRIVGVPDLSTMSSGGKAECEPVFLHIRGTCRRVRGFDQYGLVEIFFKVRRGPFAGWHGVTIEPNLLLLQRQRRVA